MRHRGTTPQNLFFILVGVTRHGAEVLDVDAFCVRTWQDLDATAHGADLGALIRGAEALPYAVVRSPVDPSPSLARCLPHAAAPARLPHTTALQRAWVWRRLGSTAFKPRP